jgi:hypothetical protein
MRQPTSTSVGFVKSVRDNLKNAWFCRSVSLVLYTRT